MTVSLNDEPLTGLFFTKKSHLLVIRAKPFEDVLIAVSQFALQLTVVRPEII